MEYFDVQDGRVVRRTFSPQQLRVTNTETTQEWVRRCLTDERMVSLHDRIRSIAKSLDLPLVATIEPMEMETGQ